MSNAMQQSTQLVVNGTGKSTTSSNNQKRQNTRNSFQGQRSNSTGKNKVGHGKSRYAKKARSNFKKAPVAKPKGPVNTYTSVCCAVPAIKKACVAVSKKDALTQTLGKFRCSACKKRCKVTVSKYKAPEALTNTGWKPVDEVKPGEAIRAVTPTGAKVTFGVTVEGDDLGRGTGTIPPEATSVS